MSEFISSPLGLVFGLIVVVGTVLMYAEGYLHGKESKKRMILIAVIIGLLFLLVAR